jgi:hypothetical protein
VGTGGKGVPLAPSEAERLVSAAKNRFADQVVITILSLLEVIIRNRGFLFLSRVRFTRDGLFGSLIVVTGCEHIRCAGATG